MLKKYISTLLAAIMLLAALPSFAAADSSNLVVVLDPGHGGTDGGNTAAEQFGYSILEKNAALSVAQYTKHELEKYDGVTVYLTRDNDRDMSLEERAAFAKSVNADIVISQHFNSSEEWSYGAEAWVSVLDEYEKTELAEKILKELALAGLHTQHGVRARASENGETWGAVTDSDDTRLADYYGIIRGCAKQEIPAVIIEHLFLSVYMDVQFADTDDDLRALGIADATAIADCYGLVKPRDYDISHANVSHILPQILKDDSSAPALTVRDGNIMLIEGSDYTLAYEHDTQEGTAALIISGAGAYTGEKRVTYDLYRLESYREKAIAFVDNLYADFAAKDGINLQKLGEYRDTAHTRIASAQTVDDIDIYISSAYYRFLETASEKPADTQYVVTFYGADGTLIGSCVTKNADVQTLKTKNPSAVSATVFEYNGGLSARKSVELK